MKQTTINTRYSANRQDKYYGIEDISWWFQYRVEIIVMMAKQYLKDNITTVDIGGSNGFNTKRLQNLGFDIVLLEPTEKACKNASKRGISKIVNGSVEDYKECISQFMLLDVIEHIEDDVGFARSICGKMKIGGYGVVTAPAFMSLWSSEDEVDGHFRRYDKTSLKIVLETAGFRVIYSSYFFSFLFIPIFIIRHLAEYLPFRKKVYERSEEEEEIETKRQFVIKDGIIKKILLCLERTEYDWIKYGKNVPFGSSIICVVEKLN